MKHGTVVLALMTILIVATCILSLLGKVSADTTSPRTKPVLGDLDLRSPTGEHVSLIPYIGRKAVVVVFGQRGARFVKARSLTLTG